MGTKPAEELPVEEFYHAVRENTIALLLGLALEAAAATLLRHFTYRQRPYRPKYEPRVSHSRTHSEADASDENCRAYRRISEGGGLPTDDDEDDDADLGRSSVTLLCCYSALAAALSALLLLPFTVVVEGWLAASLLERLWNYTSICTAVCLYGLMPFCYFFMEAHGNTIFAKSKECLKVVGLIWMLGVGLIYIVSKHLGLEHIMSSHPWITALNIFISLPCALLCGLATPRGVILIFRWTTSLALPLDHKRRLGDAISHLEFEIMALDNKLYNMQNAKPLPTTWPRVKSLDKMSPNDRDSLEDIPAKIASLSAELEVLRTRQAAHPGLRLVGVALLLSCEVLGWVCVLTRMVSSLTRELVSENLLSYAILDPLPTWWSATEVVALVYFVLATAVGFHRLARTLILKPHATPARHIIGNISLLLILSTSLPLVCGYLGLTRVMQHGPYQDLALLSRHPWALCLYKALMIWLIAITGRTR